MKNAIFETPHNEIKCILSIKESNLNKKKGQNFHICSRSEPRELVPPPPPLTVSLTVKRPFFTTPLMFSLNILTSGGRSADSVPFPVATVEGGQVIIILMNIIIAIINVITIVLIVLLLLLFIIIITNITILIIVMII